MDDVGQLAPYVSEIKIFPFIFIPFKVLQQVRLKATATYWPLPLT
jgi:hypothetical protein